MIHFAGAEGPGKNVSKEGGRSRRGPLPLVIHNNVLYGGDPPPLLLHFSEWGSALAGVEDEPPPPLPFSVQVAIARSKGPPSERSELRERSE